MTHPDDGLRPRLERLLRGEVREQDLHHLFFNMRDESKGSGVVGEVVNFIAHPIRTRGMATFDMRDLFAAIRFVLPIQTSNIIRTKLPKDMAEAMRANLRRMRKADLKRLARTNPVRAKKVLDRVLARIALSGGQNRVLMNEEEVALLNCLGSFIKGGPSSPMNSFSKSLHVFFRNKISSKHPRRMRSQKDYPQFLYLLLLQCITE
jgi:hypothetical protein